MLYNIIGGSMKKIVLTIICLFLFIIKINAKEINVKFNSCVDGDTAKFTYKDEVITARFLAIDTPETKHPTKGEEPFGKEASQYTCDKLTNAKKIVLEFDNDSDEKDKYNRYLVWVFVDGNLLQKELVKNGLASVAYLYGDYKYTNVLEEVEQDAEDNKLGIWSITASSEVKTAEEKNDINYKEIIILIGILIIVCIFSKKARSDVSKEAKKRIKKIFK